MKRIEKRLVLKHKVRVAINKLLLGTLMLLIGMIIIKENPSLKPIIQENIYEKSIKFIPIKNFYEKYFGNLLSMDKILKETTPVFSEKLNYDKEEKYGDGVKLTVDKNYMVPVIESGIIVYIGEKNNLGKTIIIEQIDGIDTYYSNININNLKLYDYIEKGEVLGESIDNNLYLKFEKNGKTIDYQEYI